MDQVGHATAKECDPLVSTTSALDINATSTPALGDVSKLIPGSEDGAQAKGPNQTQSKKTVKQRKAQTQEEFEEQVRQYKDGPPIQEEGWLDNKTFDPESKIERGYLKSAAERAYYLKDYKRVIEVLDQAKNWDIKPKEQSDLNEIRQAALAKMKTL